jgi:hypothetical protein
LNSRYSVRQTSRLTPGSWYNDAEWSDRTIRLSDGRKILAHKTVLRKKKEYFDVSKQTEIELKEDDPSALEGVLRSIYGFKDETYHDKPWEYWLSLIDTADKYLEPELSKRATIRFKALVLDLGEQDIDTVCDILDSLENEYEHFKDFMVELAMKHLKSLGDERFRAQLYSSKRIVFKLLERLSFAAELAPETVLMRCTGKSDCSRRWRTLVQYPCMIRWSIERPLSDQDLGSQTIHIVSLLPLGCGEAALHVENQASAVTNQTSPN